MSEQTQSRSPPSDDDVSEKADSQDCLTPHRSRDLPAETSAAPQDDRQESNLWPWLRVFAAWLLFLMTWGPALSYGTFQEYYATGPLASESASNISWIGGTSTTLLIMGGVIAGPLFDRGYLKPLMLIGCIMQVFAFMMLSLASKYYQIFLAQGLCYGLGCGVVYIPALAFVTVSFSKPNLRAIAVGVTTTGSSVGGIVFPVMFRGLINRVGFGWTCRTIGFVQLACATVALGLLYNAPVKKAKPRSLIDWSAFRVLPFTLFCITGFCQFLSYWVPLFYIPTFAVSKLGTSINLSVYLTVILNAASAFGRVLPAFAVARFGAATVVSVATLIATITMFTWFAVNSAAGFIIWCIAFGFVTGVFVSANPLVAIHPAISPSLDVLGTRLGMLWFFGACGALVGGPISGSLANPKKGDFVNAQGFAGAILGLGLVCMTGVLFCTIRYDRRTKREKESESIGQVEA